MDEIPQAHRLCIFLPSLAGGGAERVMVTLANEFAAKGLDVLMVLAEGAGPLRKDLDSRVTIENLACRYTILSSFKFYAVLSKYRPNIILSGLVHANIACLLTCRNMTNIRIILSEHNSLSHTLLNKGPLIRILYTLLITWFYPKANGIVCVSRGVTKELSEWKNFEAVRIRTIYNPIDLSEIRRRSAESTVAVPHACPNLPLVVASGRLVKQKGFDCLLRGFRALLDEMPCNLTIIGEGPERSTLELIAEELAISEYVRFPGFVENPFPLVKAADVFVLSSYYEGLGNVLIEAMALGVPVVSTDCTHGPREILQDGIWGRLVPVGDPGALATAILETLHAPKVPAEALVARADAFDKDRAVDSYLDFFDEIVSSEIEST